MVVVVGDFDILTVLASVVMAAVVHMIPATACRTVKAVKAWKRDIHTDFVLVHMPADFVREGKPADSAEEHSPADFEVAADEAGKSMSKMAVMVVVAAAMSMDILQSEASKETELAEEEQAGVAYSHSSS